MAFVRYGTLEMAKDFQWSGHQRLTAESHQWARIRSFIDEVGLSQDSLQRPKWGREAKEDSVRDSE